MAIKYDKMNVSYHLFCDRSNRLALLDEYIGLTNIVVEAVERRRGEIRRIGITSTGVAIIRPMNKDFVITAYLIEEDEATQVCRKAGKKCIPPKLADRIKKNLARHPELFFIH